MSENQITFETITKVKLNGKVVGEIKNVGYNGDGKYGYQYQAKGTSQHLGEVFPTLDKCKMSLFGVDEISTTYSGNKVKIKAFRNNELVLDTEYNANMNESIAALVATWKDTGCVVEVNGKVQ